MKTSTQLPPSAMIAPAQLERPDEHLHKLKNYNTPRPQIVDEIDYLPVDRLSATLFLPLISRRYERGSMIRTGNTELLSLGQRVRRSHHRHHPRRAAASHHRIQHPGQLPPPTGQAQDRLDPATLWRQFSARWSTSTCSIRKIKMPRSSCICVKKVSRLLLQAADATTISQTAANFTLIAYQYISRQKRLPPSHQHRSDDLRLVDSTQNGIEQHSRITSVVHSADLSNANARQRRHHAPRRQRAPEASRQSDCTVPTGPLPMQLPSHR